MPDFFDVVRSQRGTAYYKPDPIPDDVLDRMLEAATRAPSGSNRQPWRFIVVRDREMKRQLGELYREGQHRASGSPPTRDAGEVPVHFSVGMEDVPVLVMVCVERWEIRGSETYRGASIYPAAQNLMRPRSHAGPLGPGSLGASSRACRVASGRGRAPGPPWHSHG